MSVFGSQGGSSSILQCRELSRQDKLALLRLGVGKHLLDPDTEARLLASEPRLDLELDDPFKASTLTFKFVAVKTSFTQTSTIPLKLYFTFKFYTFHTVHSETVTLKNDGQPLKLGSQYFLHKQQEGAGLDGPSLSYNFDVDPSMNLFVSSDEDDMEHMNLARYLKDRILTIDLWNGESLMHFGTCKVPMASFMRQSNPSKVVAQEYDICEPEYGQNVGSLQLLVTN